MKKIYKKLLFHVFNYDDVLLYNVHYDNKIGGVVKISQKNNCKKIVVLCIAFHFFLCDYELCKKQNKKTFLHVLQNNTITRKKSL